MDNIFLNSYSKISNLNVSRETCNEFEDLISMIQKKNEDINIISRNIYEKKAIRDRHIIDSAQIIDIVDLNSNTTCDLGTGGGMPGLIVAIIMKKLNNRMKINHNDEKRPDEYILKVMCKDPNNRYAISLLDKFE